MAFKYTATKLQHQQSQGRPHLAPASIVEQAVGHAIIRVVEHIAEHNVMHPCIHASMHPCISLALKATAPAELISATSRLGVARDIEISQHLTDSMHFS